MKNIKRFISIRVSMVLLLGLFLVPLASSANDNLWDRQLGMGTDANEVGFQYGETAEPKDIRFFLADVINIVLGFLGIIFLILLIYGGFTWMTASGNDTKIQTAKSLMIAGVIGLVIILASFAIANFILQKIFAATLSTT